MNLTQQFQNKKITLTFLFIAFLALSGKSQNNIKGTVVNSTSNELVPFASVLLFKLNTDSLVNATSTDFEGKFKLSEIPNNYYTLKIDFVGLTPLTIDSLYINKDLNLGQISLKDGVEINEVKIAVKKTQSVLQIDKKVFSVSDNLAAIGGSATEVLNNLPSVDVDQDGNISLRGNSNLRILIDGKPTGLSGDKIGLILQQIPANSIENIEIITVPSAKYDAESSGGVINIILKQSKRQGISGSTNVNYGNVDKINAAGSITYAKEKFKVSANYAFQHGTFFFNRNSNSANSFIDTLDVFSIEGRTNKKNNSHMGKLGVVYYFKPTTSIDISSTFTNNNELNTGNFGYNWTYKNPVYNEFSERFTTNQENNSNLINNISFNHELKNKGAIKIQSTHNYSGNEDVGQFLQHGVIQDQFNNTYSNEFVQNIDITFPIKKSTTEFGAQHTHRIITNNFNFQDNTFASIGITNDFRYFDDILAAYLVESFELKSWKVSAGYRMEYTYSNSNNISSNTQIKRNYFMHFPSLNIAKEINKTQQIGLNYSRRITRPNARQLNPSPSLSDPFNLRSGNPNLIPATNDVAELSWLVKKKKISFQTTAFYQYRKNRVRRVLFIDSESVSTVQWVNYKREDYFGFEFYTNAELGKYITGNWSVTAYQRLTDGTNIDASYKANYFGWDSKLNFTASLPKNYSISVSSEYKSPKELVFGTFKPRYFIDFAVKKTVLKKKGTLSVRVSDIFNTKEYRIDTQVGDWTRNVEFKRESRILFLSFTYVFGTKS